MGTVPPKKPAVYNWLTSLNQEQDNAENETCNNRPSICKEKINFVRTLVEKDQRLTPKTVVNSADTLLGLVYTMLTEKIK